MAKRIKAKPKPLGLREQLRKQKYDIMSLRRKLTQRVNNDNGDHAELEAMRLKVDGLEQRHKEDQAMYLKAEAECTKLQEQVGGLKDRLFLAEELGLAQREMVSMVHKLLEGRSDG